MSMMIRQSLALDALRAYEADPDKNAAKLREPLQKATNEIIGQVFLSTLLKAVRAGQDKDNPFSGGAVGMMFAGELDQLLIGKIVNSSQFDVSAALAKSWFGIDGQQEEKSVEGLSKE